MAQLEDKITYNWSLNDYPKEKHDLKVFTCFSCCGGSTMGYKLAGYDVIGCNEIDKKMMEVYIKNHRPKYSFLESIVDFKERKDLPKELYDLDILDGSPPCSSFSMAGNRERDWGKKKKFNEGQKEQVLDTLFFDFIDLAKKLKPKMVIAENVTGLLMGNAKKYFNKILVEFNKAEYHIEHFVLDASKMGVPQKRKRIFFIGIRKDLINDKNCIINSIFPLKLKINLKFNENEIKFGEIYEKDAGIDDQNKFRRSEMIRWELREYGDDGLTECDYRYRGKKSFFSHRFIYIHGIVPTITANSGGCIMLFDESRRLSKLELIKSGSFPHDFNFLNIKPRYAIGMSVPPLMIYRISKELIKILKEIK